MRIQLILSWISLRQLWIWNEKSNVLRPRGIKNFFPTSPKRDFVNEGHHMVKKCISRLCFEVKKVSFWKILSQYPFFLFPFPKSLKTFPNIFLKPSLNGRIYLKRFCKGFHDLMLNFKKDVSSEIRGNCKVDEAG